MIFLHLLPKRALLVAKEACQNIQYHKKLKFLISLHMRGILWLRIRLDQFTTLLKYQTAYGSRVLNTLKGRARDSSKRVISSGFRLYLQVTKRKSSLKHTPIKKYPLAMERNNYLKQINRMRPRQVQESIIIMSYHPLFTRVLQSEGTTWAFQLSGISMISGRKLFIMVRNLIFTAEKGRALEPMSLSKTLLVPLLQRELLN
jgi:hypothetical protein